MKSLTSVLRHRVARFVLVCAVASASSLLATAGWLQTLTWLGTLGGAWSKAYGVSADGSVVVGSTKKTLLGFIAPFAGRQIAEWKTSTEPTPAC